MEKPLDRIKEVLRQYEIGAITYIEFVFFVTQFVDPEDREDFDMVYPGQTWPF